jgi:hypothetical protein
MDWRQKLNIAIAVLLLGIVGLLVFALWLNRFDPVVTEVVLRNFPTIVGLPFAFIASFIVVALFRQANSPMEFKGLGLQFQGASGEVILWLLCFVAIASMIKWFWVS